MKTKTINIVIILVTLLSILVLASDRIYNTHNDKYAQIIKFDHQVHSEDMVCADCHSKVSDMETLADDLLPEKATCASCHDVEDEENCLMCHFEDKFEPLDYIKGEIIFSHKLHAVSEKCERCHVDKKDEIMLVGNPSMSYCYNCHKDSKESENECTTCHTSTDYLVPQFHNTLSFSREHSNYKTYNCSMCHSEEYCNDCHVTTGLNIDSKIENSFPILSPVTSRSITKIQRLNKVHSLDFRFTHGIEARGRISDCNTCHQTEVFCVECHDANGLNPGGNSLLPFSHLGSNFVTIGVGTGGGEHAKLARGDIEGCVSCHDTQGNDPNCILCHIDPDGIKGTNPLTHKANFMNDNEHGDWHSSRGSVCFNCHTDPNARPNGTSGQGFCGYCHGTK